MKGEASNKALKMHTNESFTMSPDPPGYGHGRVSIRGRPALIGKVEINEHEKINYLELPARNIEATKAFFAVAFGWSFVDYGPEYTAFSNEGIDGGFFKSGLSISVENGSALSVFYSEDLDKTQLEIENAKGSIIRLSFLFQMAVAFTLAIPMVMNTLFGLTRIHNKVLHSDSQQLSRSLLALHPLGANQLCRYVLYKQ